MAYSNITARSTSSFDDVFGRAQHRAHARAHLIFYMTVTFSALGRGVAFILLLIKHFGATNAELPKAAAKCAPSC